MNCITQTSRTGQQLAGFSLYLGYYMLLMMAHAALLVTMANSNVKGCHHCSAIPIPRVHRHCRPWLLPYGRPRPNHCGSSIEECFGLASCQQLRDYFGVKLLWEDKHVLKGYEHSSDTCIIGQFPISIVVRYFSARVVDTV